MFAFEKTWEMIDEITTETGKRSISINLSGWDGLFLDRETHIW